MSIVQMIPDKNAEKVRAFLSSFFFCFFAPLCFFQRFQTPSLLLSSPLVSFHSFGSLRLHTFTPTAFRPRMIYSLAVFPHSVVNRDTIPTNSSIQRHRCLRKDSLQRFDIGRSKETLRHDDSPKSTRTRRPLPEHLHQLCHLSDQQSPLRGQELPKIRENTVSQACNQGNGHLLHSH